MRPPHHLLGGLCGQSAVARVVRIFWPVPLCSTGLTSLLLWVWWGSAGGGFMVRPGVCADLDAMKDDYDRLPDTLTQARCCRPDPVMRRR